MIAKSAALPLRMRTRKTGILDRRERLSKFTGPGKTFCFRHDGVRLPTIIGAIRYHPGYAVKGQVHSVAVVPNFPTLLAIMVQQGTPPALQFCREDADFNQTVH